MSFKDIIGQEKAKKIIAGQLASGRIPHAFLFLGPDGVGRRTFALELAKALNCRKNTDRTTFEDHCDHCIPCTKIAHGNHPDVSVIDFAWQANLENKELEKQKAIKIDTIRALQKDVNLKPVEGKWKIYLVEPAEKITLDAANCLLKTLEEPPSWTVIMLLAKHRENLPATVVSRTQIVSFSPLREQDIASWLVRKRGAAENRAREAARLSEGSLGRAVALLDEERDETSSLWSEITDRELTRDELLRLSQAHAKNAPAILNDLLAEAKAAFHASPRRGARSLEAVLRARSLIEKNVNPQMILDVLFLKLGK